MTTELEIINKRLAQIEAYLETMTRIAELGTHNNVITILKHHIETCPSFQGFEYKEEHSNPTEPRFNEPYLKTHCISCGENASSTIIATGNWPDALKKYIDKLNKDFAKPPAPSPSITNITDRIEL